MQLLGRVRRGRRQALFVQRSMLLVLPLGAPYLGDHVGAFTVAVDLTGGEESSVSARRRCGQHGDRC